MADSGSLSSEGRSLGRHHEAPSVGEASQAAVPSHDGGRTESSFTARNAALQLSGERRTARRAGKA